MLESEPTVAHAATASETLSFIPIIAVMAILLIRIKDDNIAVAYIPRENPLTNGPVRKLNKSFIRRRQPPSGSATWRNPACISKDRDQFSIFASMLARTKVSRTFSRGSLRCRQAAHSFKALI